MIFVDLLTNLERIADQCSNIALLILSQRDKSILGNHHNYLNELHKGGDVTYDKELEWQKELEEREQKRLEAELRVKLMLEAEAAEREAELQRMEAAAKEASARKSQVGSGDRSERIRTYNFPQGRVTDHRIGMTIYKLPQFIDGDMDEIIEGLILAERTKQLAGEDAE